MLCGYDVYVFLRPNRCLTVFSPHRCHALHARQSEKVDLAAVVMSQQAMERQLAAGGTDGATVGRQQQHRRRQRQDKRRRRWRPTKIGLQSAVGIDRYKGS